MAPPGAPAAAYAVERGTCPRCGSVEVARLAIGLPAGPPDPGTPSWVVFVGCCHPGHDRGCRACGLEWTAGTPVAGQ
jgi:hypothetical protein